MQRNKGILPQIASIFLSGIMVFAILWRSGHDYFEFHDAALHCAESQGESHIHDDRYAVHDCFVCAFHFSPTQTWEPGLATPTVLTIDVEKLDFFQWYVGNTPSGGNFLRGPPLFA